LQIISPTKREKKREFPFRTFQDYKKKKKKKTSRPIRKKNGGRIGTIQAIFLPCKVSSMQTSGNYRLPMICQWIEELHIIACKSFCALFFCVYSMVRSSCGVGTINKMLARI